MMVLYSDDDVTVRVHWDKVLQGLNFHTDVKSWSLSKYKKYIQVFADIIVFLKKNNFTKIYAVPPSDKEEKWQELFGFKDSGLITTDGYKIMEFDLWASK